MGRTFVGSGLEVSNATPVTVVLNEDHTISGDFILESLTVTNASTQPITVDLQVVDSVELPFIVPPASTVYPSISWRCPNGLVIPASPSNGSKVTVTFMRREP